MKIRIQTISPERGLLIQDTLPAAPLNRRMNEAPDNEITFLTDVQLDLLVRKKVQGAAITGTVATSYRQGCARCGDPIEQPLSIKLDLELKRRQPEEGNVFEDDVGIIIFDGEHLELEDIIHEHLILALSPILLPACSPAGDCLICGRKPSDTVGEPAGTIKLGDLLKDIKPGK